MDYNLTQFHKINCSVGMRSGSVLECKFKTSSFLIFFCNNLFLMEGKSIFRTAFDVWDFINGVWEAWMNLSMMAEQHNVRWREGWLRHSARGRGEGHFAELRGAWRGTWRDLTRDWTTYFRSRRATPLKWTMQSCKSSVNTVHTIL